MPERITLQVSRYRPEQESDATVDEYEVPYSRDWVVLDALNHVKDRRGRDAVLSLVVPHGHLRKLRHDRQR